MFQLCLKQTPLAVCLLVLTLFFPFRAVAQTAPDQQIPQPGELGSPFPAEHAWNHLGLEISGGYVPVVGKGVGYFNKGFNVGAGVVDHFSPRWSAMAEVQIFGLRGSSSGGSANYSNTVVSLGLAAAFDFLPRRRTGAYVIGGVGYYLLGPVTLSGAENSDLTAVDSANTVGYNGGVGIRHRFYPDRQMEIFAEGRYHYIASGSTAFGQMSLLPVGAGIRW